MMGKTMKALLLFMLPLLLPAFAAGQGTENRYAGLDSLLTEFYAALVPEDIEVKNAEMDRLIETCRDSLTRQHVALEIFNHYMHARVMGEEAVAVHVYDEWIASGKVSMRGEFERMEADIFVTFNRNSLLGMKAAEVSLRKPGGARMTIPVGGRKGVLFFYDTSCAKCRLESQLLPPVLEDVDFPLDFYAVYTGADRGEWRSFRNRLRVRNRNVKVYHLWDPEMDSDYQLMYGVTATPKMFFVLEDGEIAGRRLEVVNLQEIIHYVTLVQNGPEE